MLFTIVYIGGAEHTAGTKKENVMKTTGVTISFSAWPVAEGIMVNPGYKVAVDGVVGEFIPFGNPYLVPLDVARDTLAESMKWLSTDATPAEMWNRAVAPALEMLAPFCKQAIKAHNILEDVVKHLAAAHVTRLAEEDTTKPTDESNPANA